MSGTIRDTRMMQKALEQRWPISPEYRDGIIRRMMRIIADPSSSKREATAACKALLAAEAQNQADEQHIDHRLDGDRDRILSLLDTGRSGTDRLFLDAGGTPGTESRGAEILRQDAHGGG